MLRWVIYIAELKRVVNMNQISNYSVFENFTNTVYQITHFLKMNES